MSHGDRVLRLPPGFVALGTERELSLRGGPSRDRARSGACSSTPRWSHTEGGAALLANFVAPHLRRHGLAGRWRPSSRRRSRGCARRSARARALCGLSGGVDSTVAAALVHRAIGSRLRCIFVDNGLLRQGEREEVEKLFGASLGIDLVTVRAEQRFLSALRGVTDPERKRRLIGHLFIEIFEEQATQLGGADWLVQGTLYPDVIESVSVKGPSATIKTHHNVGGLPERMRLRLVEPLRELFKDEVREVGRRLGLPEHAIRRHPFPGPGLAIRVIGEVTPERLGDAAARRCDRHAGDPPRRPLRRALAGLRRLPPDPERRRDGRRPHLRERHRRALRDQRRRDDGRLGAPARATCSRRSRRASSTR